MNTIESDITILGGGVAGLWLLNHLSQLGYRTLLFENHRLGAGQTIVSQGMIHGGIKYALSGSVSGSSETISTMPDIWRACLRGEGPLDLRSTELLSDDYYMWSARGLSAKLVTFFGSQLVRGRVLRQNRGDYPPAFADDDFRGLLYKLVDLVLDVPSLLGNLLSMQRPNAYRIERPNRDLICRADDGALAHLQITTELRVRSQRYVFAAGAGNEELMSMLGVDRVMQRRPLHQVFVRHHYPHSIHAHCIGRGSKPLVTITTHCLEDGSSVWNLGGELAEAGVQRSAAEQIQAAKELLRDNLPWIDLSSAHWATHHVDRAEPISPLGLKPEHAHASQWSNIILAWPVKLTLVPQLADRVSDLLRTDGIVPGAGPMDQLAGIEKPVVATPVWRDIWS